MGAIAYRRHWRHNEVKVEFVYGDQVRMSESKRRGSVDTYKFYRLEESDLQEQGIADQADEA